MENQEMTMQDALRRIIGNLDELEVKGRKNLSIILESQNLLESCLRAMSQPKKPEIEVGDGKIMSLEEAKAIGAEPIC